MSVHQLDDGRWIVKYERGHNPNDPERTREYFGRGPEAEKSARARNAELGIRAYDKTGQARKGGQTFLDLAEAYLKAKIAKNEDSTIKILRYKLAATILPLLGRHEACRITPAILDDYVRSRIAEGRKRSTIRRELTDIRSILNWAASDERGYIPANPVARYQAPRPDDQIIMPPTDAEIEAIILHAPDHVRRAILIHFFAGIRPGGELFRLRWEAVDWTRRQIRVISAKKHGLPFRDVPIHKTFLPLLKSWHLADGEPQNGPIIHYQGQPIGFSIRNAWESSKAAAGVTRRLRLYDGRHAFVTRMLESGADLKSTSQIAGHASPEITMRVYQHVTARHHRDAVEKLEAPAFLGNGTGNQNPLPPQPCRIRKKKGR